MTITRLSATNLKVPAFAHDLGAVTVLTGQNYSGKSARLEAVRLALLGFCPGLPRTNSGIFSLSCGASMAVRLDMSDGSVIERAYVQKGDSIKSVETNRFDIPPVLLDAAEYLRLSEKERTKMVFGMVDVSADWTGERILQVVAETKFDAADTWDNLEDIILAKKAILDRLSDWDHDRHDCGEAVQGWLEDVVNDLRERVKTTNAALGRMEKYNQASVELRAGDGGLDAANVDRLLREKRAALQSAGEALAVAKTKQERASRDAATRKELERRLSEPFDAAAIESTRKQIAELEGAQVEQVDLADVAWKVSDVRAKLVAAKTVLAAIEQDEISLENQHNADLKSPKCPHCGTAGVRFKKAIAESYEQKRIQLGAAKTKAEKEIEVAKDTYIIGQTIYEAAALADQKAQRDRLVKQALTAELTRLETLSCNRATWTKQLAGLGPVDTVDQTAIQTMAKNILVLESEVLSLMDCQKRWVAQAHEQKRASEAKNQRVQLEAESVALKAIVKAVEAVQARLVEEAFGSILASVNKFTDGLLLTPIAYHEGELGRWAGTVWVPHRSFSGTEALVAGFGIASALARSSPIRLILGDEMGRLSSPNKRKLVERLLALTGEGFIDQCLLVDVTDEPYRHIQGVNVISV